MPHFAHIFIRCKFEVTYDCSRKNIIDSANTRKLDDIEEGWDDIQFAWESCDVTDFSVGELLIDVNILDSNSIDASNVRPIRRICRTNDEWFKIYPFFKRINDNKAYCKLCGGVFKANKVSVAFKRHILSERHRPFAAKTYASYQKRRAELLAKRYPFIKTVKKEYDVVRCAICWVSFKIGTRSLATSVTKHIAEKRHKHSQAVIEKYPFVENTSSIDVVRCKWCETDLNIIRNGDSVIEQHSRTEEHAKLAEQYSTGNSDLGK